MLYTWRMPSADVSAPLWAGRFREGADAGAPLEGGGGQVGCAALQLAGQRERRPAHLGEVPVLLGVSHGTDDSDR